MSTSNIQFTVPGHRSPGVGYEAPFEMLEACHERVKRMLSLLQRARAHGREHGCDESFSSAIKDVIRYFDNAAPQHHMDEELHIFPVVLAINDDELTDIVHRLQSEHKKMETLWAAIRVLLTLVTKFRPDKPVFTEEESALLDAFSHIYDQHIADEECRVYPAGNKTISSDSLALMAEDMMRRRGVR